MALADLDRRDSRSQSDVRKYRDEPTRGWKQEKGKEEGGKVCGRETVRRRVEEAKRLREKKQKAHWGRGGQKAIRREGMRNARWEVETK